MRADRIMVIVYRPKISPWTFRRERMRRMHRKLAVVEPGDRFCGRDQYIEDSETTGEMPPRYDYAVGVEGSLVDGIRRSARRLWSMTAWGHFRKGAAPRCAGSGLRRWDGERGISGAGQLKPSPEQMMYELGALDQTFPFEELKRRSRINGRSNVVKQPAGVKGFPKRFETGCPASSAKRGVE